MTPEPMMMFAGRLWCTVAGWWRTLRTGLPVSGCDFVEQKDGTLWCPTCGRRSR